jgi:hypothetical protein
MSRYAEPRLWSVAEELSSWDPYQEADKFSPSANWEPAEYLARQVEDYLASLADRYLRTARTQNDPHPSSERSRGEPIDHDRVSANTLSPYRGKWVAIRGGLILIAADSRDEIIERLLKSRSAADLLFRVPLDPTNERLDV